MGALGVHSITDQFGMVCPDCILASVRVEYLFSAPGWRGGNAETPPYNPKIKFVCVAGVLGRVMKLESKRNRAAPTNRSRDMNGAGRMTGAQTNEQWTMRRAAIVT